MSKSIFKKNYLSTRFIILNIVTILTLASLAGYLYYKGYFQDLANASRSITSVTYNVKTNDDLMNQEGNSIARGSKEMWIGTGKNRTRSYIGIRFTGKKIPKGVRITAAELTFTAAQSSEESISTEIFIEKSTSPLPFSPNNTPFNRKLLNESKTQIDELPWQNGKSYSYDVTNLVNDAYKSNNLGTPIVFIIQGKDDTVNKKSIFGSPNSLHSPKLKIQYQLKKQ